MRRRKNIKKNKTRTTKNKIKIRGKAGRRSSKRIGEAGRKRRGEVDRRRNFSGHDGYCYGDQW